MSIFNLFKKKQTENVYHRFLNIPVDPEIDLFKCDDYETLLYRHITVSPDDVNPKLVEWFENIGIKFYLFEAFYTPPYGGKIPVHTDTTEICNVAKINWTYGAPGSKLIWWKAKDEKYIDKFYTEFGNEYLTAKQKHCKKVFEAEIKKPSLVNIGQFHSTYNPTDEGRWTLSLPLVTLDDTRRLTWDEAVELLQDHFDNEQV